MYKENNYIIATLLDPRFKALFFDTATSELAVQRLIAVSRIEPALVLKERVTLNHVWHSFKFTTVIYQSSLLSLVLQTQVAYP